MLLLELAALRRRGNIWGNSFSDTEAKFASDFCCCWINCVRNLPIFDSADFFLHSSRLEIENNPALCFSVICHCCCCCCCWCCCYLFPFATLTQFCFRVSFASAALVAAFLSRVVLPFIFSKAPSMGICANTNTHGQIAAYSPRLLLFLVTAKSNTFICYYLVCSRHWLKSAQIIPEKNGECVAIQVGTDKSDSLRDRSRPDVVDSIVSRRSSFLLPPVPQLLLLIPLLLHFVSFSSVRAVLFAEFLFVAAQHPPEGLSHSQNPFTD